MFNLLPNLNMEELSRAFSVKTNDMMLVIYTSALIRSVLALHNLIGNKEQRLAQQREPHIGAAPNGSNGQKDDGSANDGKAKDNSDEVTKGEAANKEAEAGHPPGASGT